MDLHKVILPKMLEEWLLLDQISAQVVERFAKMNEIIEQ